MKQIELFNDHFQNFKAYGFEIKKNFYKEANEKNVVAYSNDIILAPSIFNFVLTLF